MMMDRQETLTHVRRLIDHGLTDWSANAGEISGWVRLLSPLALWMTAVRRKGRQFLGVLAFLAASPYVFSSAREDTWMNRALRGEYLWLRSGNGGLHRWLSIGSGAAVGLSLLLGAMRRVKASLLWLLAGSALCVVHHDRLATRFVHTREQQEEL